MFLFSKLSSLKDYYFRTFSKGSYGENGRRVGFKNQWSFFLRVRVPLTSFAYYARFDVYGNYSIGFKKFRKSIMKKLKYSME